MQNIGNLMFYVPGVYAYQSRMKLKGFLKMFTKYVVITAGLPFMLNGGYLNVALYVLAVLFVYNLYEIGYIENDTETIKHEVNPTLRLTKGQLDFYYAHRWSVYGVRLVVSVLLALVLINVIGGGKGVAYPIIMAYLLIPSYLIYNRTRSGWSQPIYLWLMTVRHVAVAWICTEVFGWMDAIFIILAYPFPTFVSRLSIKRFGYSNKFVCKYILRDYRYLHQYRYRYYLLLALLVVPCGIFNHYFVPHAVISVYLFVFCYAVWKRIGVKEKV